jgi:hypothetical protein
VLPLNKNIQPGHECQQGKPALKQCGTGVLQPGQGKGTGLPLSLLFQGMNSSILYSKASKGIDGNAEKEKDQ